MTQSAAQVKSDLKRLCAFFDGRTNGGPKPTIQITRTQMAEIRRNPQACGCVYGADGVYYCGSYELEVVR